MKFCLCFFFFFCVCFIFFSNVWAVCVVVVFFNSRVWTTTGAHTERSSARSRAKSSPLSKFSKPSRTVGHLGGVGGHAYTSRFLLKIY